MGAPKGNKNAQKSKKGHDRRLISVSGTTLDLVYEALALEGNFEPDGEAIKNAIYYAVRLVYGRRLENDQAIIL